MITKIKTMTINQIAERKNDLLVSTDDIKGLARNVRNKAIDDYTEKIRQKAENDWIYDLESESECKSFIAEINEIAEQMKAGVKYDRAGSY